MHGYGKLEWANGDTYHGAFVEVRNDRTSIILYFALQFFRVIWKEKE
jgi:hypothetical protein